MDQIKEIFFTNNSSFLTAQYSLWPWSLDKHSQETPRVLQVLLSTSYYETHYDPNLIQGDCVQYEQSEAADLPRVFRDKVSNLNLLEFTILFSLMRHAEFTMFSLVTRQASLGKNEMVIKKIWSLHKNQRRKIWSENKYWMQLRMKFYGIYSNYRNSTYGFYISMSFRKLYISKHTRGYGS